MKEDPRKPEKPDVTFATEVGGKATRKLEARGDPAQVWLGLGMMGIIGWSVAVPTVLGAGLGLYLDDRTPGRHSWTLALLVVGLLVGCLNAWHWVAKENKAIGGDDHE